MTKPKIQYIYNEKFTEKEMLKLDNQFIGIFPTNKNKVTKELNLIKKQLKSAWWKGFLYGYNNKLNH